MKSREHLRAAERLERWARASDIDLDASDLALVALLCDQPPRIAGHCLERLAIRGEPLAILQAAVAAGPLAKRLERTPRPSDVAEMLRPLPVTVLAGAWLRAAGRARRRIEWFLTEGGSARPLLSGDDVVALGVPRGPAVGACLAALRRLRLDGGAASVARERAYVRRWLRDSGSGDDPGSKGGRR